MQGSWKATALLAALCSLVPVDGAGAQPSNSRVGTSPGYALPNITSAVRSFARDACGKSVVLLGENGFHGDGVTQEIKGSIVRRLIRDCGFKAILFESSYYDMAALQRDIDRGAPTDGAMLVTAIGGIWNHNTSMLELVADLWDPISRGKLRIWGLDDQVGARGMVYSLSKMSEEISTLIPASSREECKTRLDDRIASRFTRENPYTTEVKGLLVSCIDLAKDGAKALHKLKDRDFMRGILENLTRQLERDKAPREQMAPLREQSLFRNYEAFTRMFGAKTKLIIWTANAHARLGSDGIAGLNAQYPTLGGFIKAKEKSRTISLGFTAAGGSYRYSRSENRPIALAAPDSLEAKSLSAGQDVAYLGESQLQAIGSVTASALDDHLPYIGRWSTAYDALIIIRKEAPPIRNDQ